MPMVMIPLAGGRPIVLEKAIIFFGRGAECDVVLTASRKVSRKHCCVAQIEDYHVVRDLGSMNGVRVNDQLVDTEQRLSAGDEVWVGDVGFRLQFVEAPQAGAANAKSKKPAPVVDPRYLSLDIPVVIPEEGAPFGGDAKRPRKGIPSDEIIEIGDDDIIE
ncbi:FHA domain-containing protein [Planctomicrobium sp. SH664]|uniref:FHA domain-containing protein n=1 Tax=Planctomicrobium sp. SH664 TaxID=3448125 RepID=UPI003F5C6E0E